MGAMRMTAPLPQLSVPEVRQLARPRYRSRSLLHSEVSHQLVGQQSLAARSSFAVAGRLQQPRMLRYVVLPQTAHQSKAGNDGRRGQGRCPQAGHFLRTAAAPAGSLAGGAAVASDVVVVLLPPILLRSGSGQGLLSKTRGLCC